MAQLYDYGVIPIKVPDGQHTIYYWSIDKAGNVEARKQVVAKSDLKPPVTTVTGLPANGQMWRNTLQVSVSLSASDTGGTGVQRTQVAVDGGAEGTYTGPFTITGEGNHLLNFYSIDKAGNREPMQTAHVGIDRTRPVASGIQATPSALNPFSPMKQQLVTVTGTVRDALSGMNPEGTYTVTDSYGELQLTGPAQAWDGAYSASMPLLLGDLRGPRVYTVKVTVKDKAGNAVTNSIQVSAPSQLY